MFHIICIVYTKIQKSKIQKNSKIFKFLIIFLTSNSQKCTSILFLIETQSIS